MSSTRLFELGCIYVTSGVDAASTEFPSFLQFVASRIIAHGCGEWDTMCSSDADLNQRAVSTGGRVFSSYQIPEPLMHLGHHLWVITESDRSSTTVLFPGEY